MLGNILKFILVIIEIDFMKNNNSYKRVKWDWKNCERASDAECETDGGTTGNKKQGGSLCFYGDWFGRPFDNYHEIKEYSYSDDVLEIVFETSYGLIIQAKIRNVKMH